MLMISKEASVVIGKNCFFNNFCSINSNKKIVIGDNTIFGENVKIYDHNHKFRSISKSIKSQGFSCAEIHIGSNCWIGSNVCILKGAIIGDGCVIGAGCIIDRILPPRTLVKLNHLAIQIEEKIR